MLDNSTICAIATAPGPGAIAVIRLSGKNAITICNQIFVSPSKNKKLLNQKANTLHYGQLVDNDVVVDEVVVSIFKSPYSYTGEDTVEISCHGSVLIQQEILVLLTKYGARLATPGEFTLRAFLNGKMDLSQAEAVADLINSSSEVARKVALHQMRGGFSSEIKVLRDQLLNFISLIELELDFSEEEVEFADRSQLKDLLLRISALIRHLAASFKQGNVIKNGVPVAIVGAPNVGKSTLLNVLLNEDRAIVSPIAGTTRDVIEDTFSIQGITFRFIDTAGLRKTDDVVENLGIERTHEKIKGAAIVLLLVSAEDTFENAIHQVQNILETIESYKNLLLIINKTDKNQGMAEIIEQQISKLINKQRIISISAKTHKNVNLLIDNLLETVNLKSLNTNEVVITNLRHYEALTNANEALERALEGMNNGLPGDLFAQDIREALHHLGLITGEITTDEVLVNIFSKFCIGK
jgi:tRNA modification GTPase